MNKLYSVHDHWTDINKKNDVDIESIDGVITGIKVNGEDYGGGGGSSDFSTAQVTVNITGDAKYQMFVLESDKITIVQAISTEYTIPLYKGVAVLPLPPANLSKPPVFTGNVELSIPDTGVKVTGDGTITLVGPNIS